VALLACPADPPSLTRWHMLPLEVEPGYAAALTVERGGFAVSAFDAPDDDGVA